MAFPTRRTGHRAPRALLTTLGASLAFGCLARPANAAEPEVTASSSAQVYSLSSPFGSLTLPRRRFTQTLGLGIYHLEGEGTKPGEADFSVQLRLRLDSDAGVSGDEVSFAPSGADRDRFIPGLQSNAVDLMYGYVEGRHLLGGWLGFRLGRQQVSNSLGWWGYDGALVRITTPVFVQIEAYGGLEQRGGLPLSTPRFERGGVWRGDRSGFTGPDATQLYPAFLKANIAPAYGVALESAGPTWIHGRLDYRKVNNTGEVSTQGSGPTATTYSGSRVSSERLGYAMDATVGKFGGLKGGVVYDLFNGFASSYYGNVDVYAGPKVTVGADYDYFRPTFDGDSIWNYFTHDPLTTITGRAAVQASDRLDFAASGGIRSFTTDEDPATYTTNTGTEPRNKVSVNDILGNVSGRYRSEDGMVGLRGLVDRGDRGHQQGGDVYGERYWMGGRWLASARVSVYDWKDDLRPDRNATSFQYVLGAGFRPSEIAQARLEWEHDMNRIVGQRFRLLAVLNIAVNK